MISLELIMAAAQIRAEIDLTMSHGVSLSLCLGASVGQDEAGPGDLPLHSRLQGSHWPGGLSRGMVWTPTRAWRPGTSAGGGAGLRAGAPGRITGMVSWLLALLSGRARDCSLQVNVRPVRVPAATLSNTSQL